MLGHTCLVASRAATFLLYSIFFSEEAFLISLPWGYNNGMAARVLDQWGEV